jgi:putative protease
MELLKGTKIPVGIATPRIFKQGEEEILHRLVSYNPAHLLVCNLGALQLLKSQKIPLWGDHSLNVTNSLSAAWLLQLGLSRLTPSIELDDPQLLALLDSALLSARQFELPLQLKTPLFHTEHCLYADRLGKRGTPATCGKPCLRHQIDLKDQKGEIHTLLRDLHCRNTLYRGAAKNSAHLIPALRRRGVHHFRIEFVGESADQVIEKVRELQQLFKT